jgi:hypothetical protein
MGQTKRSTAGTTSSPLILSERGISWNGDLGSDPSAGLGVCSLATILRFHRADSVEALPEVTRGLRPR